MREKLHCCPNCDTVMVLRYEPDEDAGTVYECPICGHRAAPDPVRSLETETPPRRYAH